jgi:hypothetical protein
MTKVIPIQRGGLAGRLRETAPVRTVDACPDDPEDTAEQYLLCSLPAGEAERFEEHYLVCESCAEFLRLAEDYISSIRIAGLRLAKSRLHLL